MNTPVFALYGGAFDPPHVAHKQVVEDLLKNPGIQRLLVIPTGASKLKPTQTPAHHRLEMTKLAFEDSGEKVEVSDIEIKRALQLGKISYSIDTIQELESLGNLAFVVGTDQWEQLESWHRFPELIQKCHWIIIDRKDDLDRKEKMVKRWNNIGLFNRPYNHLSFAKLFPQAAPSLTWELSTKRILSIFSTQAAKISSSTIRANLCEGNSKIKPPPTPFPPELLIPEKVKGYLLQHRLYGTGLKTRI